MLFRSAWLTRRLLLRMTGEGPLASSGETGWLLVYAPLSLAYRLTLWVALVVFLGSHWVVLGVLGFLCMMLMLFARPLYEWIRLSHAMAREPAARVRLSAGLAVCAVVAGLLLFVVPVPLATVAPAVAWLPENAQVRPEVEIGRAHV